MTDFTTGPILGDLGQQAKPATVPFGAFEGQEPFELLQQEGRFFGRQAAIHGTFDEAGNQVTEPEPKISAEDAQSRYGLGDLKFDGPVPESVAKQLHDTKQAEIDRAFVANYSPGGFWNGAARFGAGFALNALDPNNIAASFIPVVGEARYARWMMDAGSALGRTAVRAGVGAAQGAAGQVPLIGLHYGLSKDEQADYSAGDAMLDVAYGGLLGGGMHATLGGLFDGFPKRETSRVSDADLSTQEGALRSALAQMQTGRQVDVAPVFEAASLRSRLMGGTSLTPVADEGLERALAGEPEAHTPTQPEVSQTASVIRGIDDGTLQPTTAAVAAHLGVPESEAAQLLGTISRRPDAPIEPVRPARTTGEKMEDVGKEADLSTMRWRRVSADRRETRIREHEDWAHKTFGLKREDFADDAAYVDAMSSAMDRQKVAQVHADLIERAKKHGIDEPEKLSPADLLAEVSEREAMAGEGDADRFEHEIDAIVGPHPKGYDEIPWDHENERAAEAPAQPAAAPGAPGGAVGPEHPTGSQGGAGGAPEGAAGGGEPPALGHPGGGTELTAQGQQFVIPGAERSARQAAESREATGRGRIRSAAEQRAPNEGLFANRSESLQRTLLDAADQPHDIPPVEAPPLPLETPKPEDMAALEQAVAAGDKHLTAEDHAALTSLTESEVRAQAIGKGIAQAAACIARGLE